eukprot:GEMP01011991.1.p1 GENE.GEMP01011991.1~~GEMP01011991.1.p1  ORF type:complete len:739 (+),score=210.81 GEMP01011991.1:116-2332(+)
MSGGDRDELLQVVTEQRKRLFELEKRLELAAGQKKVGVSRLSSARSSNKQREKRRSPYPDSPGSLPVRPVSNPDAPSGPHSRSDVAYPLPDPAATPTPPYPPLLVPQGDVPASHMPRPSRSQAARMAYSGLPNVQHQSQQQSDSPDTALSGAWRFNGRNSHTIHIVDPAISAITEPAHTSSAAGPPRGLPSYRPPPYLHDHSSTTAPGAEKADSTTVPQQPIPRVERAQQQLVSKDPALHVPSSTLRPSVPYNQPGLRLSYPQMSPMLRPAELTIAPQMTTHAISSPHTPPVPAHPAIHLPSNAPGDAYHQHGARLSSTDDRGPFLPPQKDGGPTFSSQPSAQQRLPPPSEDVPRLVAHVHSAAAARLSSHPPLHPCGPLPLPVRRERSPWEAKLYGDTQSPRGPLPTRQAPSTCEAPLHNDTQSPRGPLLLPARQSTSTSTWQAPLHNDTHSDPGNGDGVCSACGHKSTDATRPHSARGVLQGSSLRGERRSVPPRGNPRPNSQQQSAPSVPDRQQRPSSTGPQVTRRTEEWRAAPVAQKFGPNLTYIPGRSSLWSNDFEPQAGRGDISAIGLRSDLPDPLRDPGVRLQRPSGAQMLPPPLGRSGDDGSRGSHFSSSSGPIRATFIPPTYAHHASAASVHNGPVRPSVASAESFARTTSHATAPAHPGTPEGATHHSRTRALSECAAPDSAVASGTHTPAHYDTDARKASFAERAGHLRAQLAHVLQSGGQHAPYAK